MSTATAANPKKNESRPTLNPKSATRKKIWVDLDNSPHVPFFRPIIEELRKQGADDIVVFVGGVIPQQDYDFLYKAGVKGIYGPGTPIPASAKDVLEQIRKALAAK